MLIVCPKCAVKYQTPETVMLSFGKKVKCSNCQHVFCLSEETVLGRELEDNSAEPILEENSTLPQEASAKNVFADEQVFKNDVPQPFVPVPSQEPEKNQTVGLVTALICFVVVVTLCIVGIIYKDIIFNEILIPIPPRTTSAVIEKRQSESKQTQPKEQSLPRKEAVSQQRPLRRSTHIEPATQVVLLPQIQSVRFERQEGAESTIRIEGILKNTTQRDLMLPKTVRAIGYNAQGQILFEKEIYLTDERLPKGEERPFFGSYQPAPENVQWVDVTF